jgi:CRP/FNR family transcriptional regulator, dissimilatory nitrate respiration regulator
VEPWSTPYDRCHMTKTAFTAGMPATAWLVPPLADFDPALQALTQTRRLAMGEPLFLQGQTPHHLYYVVSGAVAMARCDRAGRQLVLQRATSGFLAEASLCSSSYHCDAHASVDSQVLALPLEGLRRAIDQHAGTRWAWIRMLAGEIRRQRAQSERLSLKTVRERVLHLLVTQGEGGCIELPGSRKALAEQLGVSHEALYRSLGMLIHDGELLDQGKRLCLSA